MLDIDNIACFFFLRLGSRSGPTFCLETVIAKFSQQQMKKVATYFLQGNCNVKNLHLLNSEKYLVNQKLFSMDTLAALILCLVLV